MPARQRDLRKPDFLNSWKAIANYLGKGVGTVQRYERNLGLPVRRPAGKSRSSVIATRPEIDAWVAVSPLRNSYRLSRARSSHSAAERLAVKEAIVEMHKLREQTMALRLENRAARATLIDKVKNFCNQMKTNEIFNSLKPEVGILSIQNKN